LRLNNTVLLLDETVYQRKIAHVQKWCQKVYGFTEQHSVDFDKKNKYKTSKTKKLPTASVPVVPNIFQNNNLALGDTFGEL
jgi:hypothetical protein